MRALLRDALRALERQAQAVDIELGVTVDGGRARGISLDPEKIAWAVSALVGNAMRYVRHGTRQVPGGSIAVSAAVDSAAGELCLVVEDDDPGMPADVTERLFQRAPGAPCTPPASRSWWCATSSPRTADRWTSPPPPAPLELGTTVTLRIPLA